jgi:DNA-binding response OmpR family regulator
MGENPKLFENGELVAGSYEIRSVLGEGGMGRVYGAHDLVLARRVAIKASWPLVDKSLLLKEAQAIAAIRHPGMIDVYGAGTHRGIPYLVMEFLYGVDLESFLAKRRSDTAPFDVREAIDVLIAVADALAAVHRSGIAHRDVKPGNIMLTPNGRIVLMDFGLFRPENAASATLCGTPEYMSPEAVRPDTDPRDAFYADIYALGITAYELLTGAVPFQGEDAVATLKLHKNQPAPNLRDVRADIPPRLSALVREMLAKEALERPPSMEAIVFRLRAVKEALETRAPQKTFSVLVVDDDVALGKLIGMYAQRALPEAEVRVVEDAERALLAVRDRAPDAMLLDLHMPRMNGIELCMMLRGARLADQCTVIAVSAGAREADIDLLKQLGITRFVPKGAEIGARLNPLLRELHEAWKRSRGADRTMTTLPGLRTMSTGSNLVGAGHATIAPSSARGKAVLDVVVPRVSGTADSKGARGGGRIDEKRLELLRQLAQLLPEERVTLVDADLQELLAELRRD